MLPEDKFCPGCGSPLERTEIAGKSRPTCAPCRRVIYYDPKVAAVVIVARENRILMVRRANQPGYGLWSVPGGYVDRGEVVERAAAREVQEETGLVVEIAGLLGLFSQTGSPVIVAAFAGMETGGVLCAGPETLAVDFFPQDALPPLAFPRDSEMLNLWMEWRRRNNPGDLWGQGNL